MMDHVLLCTVPLFWKDFELDKRAGAIGEKPSILIDRSSEVFNHIFCVTGKVGELNNVEICPKQFNHLGFEKIFDYGKKHSGHCLVFISRPYFGTGYSICKILQSRI